ncbi:hypothetical protein ACWCXX_21160 [Streptomyces sp. NPDC001732]
MTERPFRRTVEPGGARRLVDHGWETSRWTASPTITALDTRAVDNRP